MRWRLPGWLSIGNVLDEVLVGRGDVCAVERGEQT